jgi:hypothetical protein
MRRYKHRPRPPNGVHQPRDRLALPVIARPHPARDTRQESLRDVVAEDGGGVIPGVPRAEAPSEVW